jgi:hypothetical protein
MKSLMRYRGLMVIALWQAVPIGTDQYGRTRLGFGLGTGQLEYATLACDGSVIDADAAPYRTVAAEVEHWVVPGKLRLHGSGGYQWADSASSRGPFGAVLLAYDGRKIGIGAGLAQIHAANWLPSPDVARYEPGLITLPTAYVRFGNRDRVHLRSELFPPGVHTPAEGFRLVIGYNQFDARRASGYAGLAVISASSNAEATMGIVGEFFAPVSASLALGVHGFASPGYREAQTGLAAQARLTLR